MEVPLCNLGLSMTDFVPCDPFIQIAISYTTKKPKICWFVLRLILVIKGINTKFAHKFMCPVI